MRLRSRDLFGTAHTEGGLLPADLLARVADGDASIGGLGAADYHLAPGERLGEAITRSWTRLSGAWSVFDDARRALPPVETGGRLTRERWLHVLFDELGYGRLVQQPAVEIEGKSYPVFTQWQHTPIHLVGCGVGIDARTAGVKGAAVQSPHSLVQELLNRSPERLWGFVSNGLVLRVLRDSVALTRQAYLEFDLEAMFSGEVYADFVVLWLVCHQSRVEADRPEDCWLERWSRTAGEDGTRALEALRQGVTEAIERLGAGFLAHRANRGLHDALRDGQLDARDYYRALLRLVYRLLFLFVAEDRDALLDPAGDQVARDRYLTHYSTRQLRVLAARRRGGRQHDRYEQLKLVMTALDSSGSAPLALPALGSYLWSAAAIGPLADAVLANHHLLDAIRSLSTVETGGVRRSVDFRNLGAEELGSVYESLLELHPSLDRATATFALESAAGSERKETGSYYTPTSLISSLLDTALEPVLDEAARGEDPAAAILALAVVDPACGSGHFLIAAANRIARRLAAVRSQDPEPSPGELRAALRDVVGRCIHGVDVNPMAVELCKVSLWMEALEPGRPLSFLDHRIAAGNSLLGATPELIAAGIPAEAFKPILGDDKKHVTELRKRNAKELGGQLALDLGGGNLDADAHALAEHVGALNAVDDHSLAGIREQQRRFEALLGSPELRRAALAADVWCTAFVAEKRAGAVPITEGVLASALSDDSSLSVDELAVVAAVRERYRFLHWHVAFPDVWERGGFDVVLGNPPWEHTELKEKEFFATRCPEIAAASTGAARKRMIDKLAEDDPPLHAAFEAAKREAEGISHFVRSAGRYPLCGRGRINTYAIFAELMRSLVGPMGRTGCVVPTGIATEDTTKYFFQSITDERSLVSLFDFENRTAIFPGVHRSYKFSLLTLTGAARPSERAEFVFFATAVDQLDDPARRFALTSEEIARLNPNTRTCPVFRARRDADLTLRIYAASEVLCNHSRPGSWRASLGRMLNLSDDSGAFRERAELDAAGLTLSDAVMTGGGETYYPVWEAKMFHIGNHRWFSYTDGRDGRELTDDERASPATLAYPRYWVDSPGIDAWRRQQWTREWFLVWRDITNTTNERTMISAVIPRGGVGNSAWIALTPSWDEMHLLFANFTTFVFDYTARNKAPGTHLSPYIVEQLPVVARPRYREAAPWDREVTVGDWVTPRSLELAYTAVDLRPFAADLGYSGPPFPWRPDRRGMILSELDAAFARLYGLERDDVEYILDTFPIVRRKDEQRFGEHRTKRLILERYDAMVAAEASGVAYETPLDPPPGKQRIEVTA